MNELEPEPNSLAFELYDDEYDALWMRNEDTEAGERDFVEHEAQLANRAWEQHYSRHIEPKLQAAIEVLQTAGYQVRTFDDDEGAYQIKIFDSEIEAWVPQVSVAYDGTKNDCGTCYEVVVTLLYAQAWFTA